MGTFDLLAAATIAAAAVWCVNYMRPVTVVLLVAVMFWIAVGMWAFR